jgi:hypothetical protein
MRYAICYMCSRIDRGEERSDGLDCSGGPGEWDCIATGGLITAWGYVVLLLRLYFYHARTHK